MGRRMLVGMTGTALACALLVGCSGDDADVTGRWLAEQQDGGVTVIDYRDDGSFTAFEGPSRESLEQVDDGTYSLDGARLTFETDAYCREHGGERATYAVSVEADALTYAVQGADPCGARAGLLDGVTYTRQSEQPSSPAPATSAVGPAVTGGGPGGGIPWWNERVFYEVFVRSFADSDGDGIGDLRGLIDRLDHLNDGDPSTDADLGVTGLWLMPVTQSPSYHGYDATDYFTVEEDYGTNADFKALMEAAHARGINVIVDLMLNHTSRDHPWFTESASGPDSPKRDWYVWSDTDPVQTTEWGSPAWHRWGEEYYLGLFWSGMPDLNLRTPAVTEQLYDVARFWLGDLGADGLRLDAVRHLVEDGAVFEGTPETHAWLAAWDDHLDSVDPQALTVGEVWDETSEVVPYVADDEVDIAFEFTVAEGILSSVATATPRPFDEALTTALAAYPAGQFAPFLTNHDQNRVMSRLGDDLEGARLAATALLTLPGVPFVYYGEEIGMTGAKPDELIRTPMQWSSGAGAGFTTGTPWQAPNPDPGSVNVAAQTDDPASLLSHYRRLIRARADHPALRTGDLREVEVSCPDVYGYLRTQPGDQGGPADSVLVLLNFATVAQRGCAVDLAASAVPAGVHAVTDLATDAEAAPLTVADGSIAGYVPVDSLAPRQGLVLAVATD